MHSISREQNERPDQFLPSVLIQLDYKTILLSMDEQSLFFYSCQHSWNRSLLIHFSFVWNITTIYLFIPLTYLLCLKDCFWIWRGLRLRHLIIPGRRKRLRIRPCEWIPFYGRTIVNLRWHTDCILQKYSLVYVLYTVCRMPVYTVTYCHSVRSVFSRNLII